MIGPSVSLTTVIGLVVLPATAFALLYFPLIARVSPGLVSPYPKADVRKRLYAAAIDSLLVSTTVYVSQHLETMAFLILGAIYLLLRDGVRGHRLAQTQVVEGLGVKDLAAEFVRWWTAFVADLTRAGRRRRRGSIARH